MSLFSHASINQFHIFSNTFLVSKESISLSLEVRSFFWAFIQNVKLLILQIKLILKLTLIHYLFEL
jgi:hypothetical protein